jgi:flagellar biosynthesis GTPase FlhF
MRTHFIRAVILAALAAPATLAGADVLSQLGITLEAARQAIGSVVTAGVYNPGLPAQAFKLLPPAARAQITTAGVSWVKSYVNSPDFKKQYAQVRQNHRPEAPTWELTPEQELQKADAEQAQQMEESKQAIASLPPEQRKMMEEALKAAAAATAKTNTPELRKMRLDAIKMDRAERTKEHEEAVARWSKDYPDDPKAVVVKRLREFMQLSADVDYDAKLKTTGSRSQFENPAYEAKPAQWKMCFRAGREATTAARAAVQAWLAELGG